MKKRLVSLVTSALFLILSISLNVSANGEVYEKISRYVPVESSASYSFETRVTATEYTDIGGGWNRGGTFKTFRSTDYVVSGTYSAKITNPSNGSGSAYKANCPAGTSGDKVGGSLWVYVPNTTSFNSFSLTIKKSGTPQVVIAQVAVPTSISKDVWQKVIIPPLANSTYEGQSCILEINYKGSSTADSENPIYVDDFVYGKYSIEDKFDTSVSIEQYASDPNIFDFEGLSGSDKVQWGGGANSNRLRSEEQKYSGSYSAKFNSADGTLANIYTSIINLGESGDKVGGSVWIYVPVESNPQDRVQCEVKSNGTRISYAEISSANLKALKGEWIELRILPIDGVTSNGNIQVVIYYSGQDCIYIDNCVVGEYNELSAEIQSATKINDSINVELLTVKSQNSSINVDAVMTVYGDDNKIIGLVIEPNITVLAGRGLKTSSIPIANEITPTKVKVFLWDINTLKPYSKSAELTLIPN